MPILDSFLLKIYLQGKRVFVTSNVKPSQAVVTSLVKASSGQVSRILFPKNILNFCLCLKFELHANNDWISYIIIIVL
jgi:hypothetical protein